MSLRQGPKKAPNAPHNLDGSDGPAHQPKSQTQFAKEVVAHLEAARAALRQLTVASVEDLCADPGLDPVFVGCMREMARLGFGHGGKEGVVQRSTPGIDQRRTAALIDEGDAWKNPGPSSISGYVFTAHFFPRETYGRCARADRPSDDVLTSKMTAAMKDNPTTAHIITPTRVSWTAHGDVTIRVPADAVEMVELVRQIDILEVMKRAFSPSFPAPQWATYRMRGDPVAYYLQLHRVPNFWTSDGDWWRLSNLLHGIGIDSAWSLGVIDSVYQLPESFPIVGRTLANGGQYDILIDLCGLDHAATETLRKACNNGFQMAARAKFESNYSTCYGTSFHELKD